MSCLSLSPTPPPSSFEDVYQRIQTVTQTRTQQELAALLGIRQSDIADAKRRDSIPSDWVLTLFVKLGINPDWLLQGTGPVFLRTDQGYIASDHNTATPAHMLRAHAAPAIIPLHGTYLPLEVTGRLAVPRHLAFKDCMAFRVESDVLFPCIRCGSFIGINTAQRRPMDGEIYAISWKDVLIFRKFKIIVVSDEQFCTLNELDCEIFDVVLPTKEIKNLIRGRLAWVIQEF